MNTAPITLESLAVRVTSLERSVVDNHESHGSIYARIEAVEKGHAVLNTNLNSIWQVLNEIKEDVKDLKERPARRWDTMVFEVVKWIVIAVLGAVVVFE